MTVCHTHTHTHTHNTHTHTWVQAILNRCFVGEETSNVLYIYIYIWVQAILNRCFVGEETSNVEIPLLKKGGIASSEVSLKHK